MSPIDESPVHASTTRTPQRVLLSTAIGLAACALPAMAQVGTSSQSPASSNDGSQSVVTLETVVVTARRESESLLDVPLAITAFEARQIENFGLRSLDAIASQTPGLTFANYSGGFLPTPVVRGVSQVNLSDSEPNTALFVDGVLMPARRALGFNQIDVERIEVVKGPQSALYGGNSFSGAINIITAKPSDTFKATAEATLGDHNRQVLRASVSGPLVDGLVAGRLAAGYEDWDGSYRNVNPRGGGDIGGHHYESVSGALRFTPGERLDIMASAYFSKDRNDERPSQAILANADPSSTGKPLNLWGEMPSLPSSARRVLPEAIGDRRELRRAQLNISWETDVGTVTALTGYSWVSHYAVQDIARNGGDAAVPFVYQTPTGPATVYVGLLQPNDPKRTEDVSQELRFTTPQDRPVRGSLGVYYARENQRSGAGGVKSVDPLPANSLGLYPRVPGPPFFISIGNSIFGSWFGPNAGTNPNEYSRDRATSLAWFGHVESDFTDQLTARAELRYTREKRSFVENLNGNSGDGKWDYLTPRFSLDYTAREDLLFYASAARGVKSGGFSSSTNSGQFVYRPFEPESNWSYELGMKGMFAERRISADLALFFIDWTDIVLPQTDVSFSPPVVLKVNAGDATSKGVEGSLRAVIVEGLTATVGASYTHAKLGTAQMDGFKDFAAFRPNGDISGQWLPRQSRWQFNTRLDWKRHAFGDFDFFFRPDASFQSRQYIGPDNASWVPDRTVVNLRLGLESSRYSVELWATNLLDDRKAVSAYRDVGFNNTINGVTSTTNTIFPWRYSVNYGDLRSIGATVRVRF
ncbi:MAG: TonB-dependent receptor [Sinobacteraceae bacterium]|nr:TonB-dependent receptor [Nevskiaceae bacterium]MCP5338976.1 TonB-dependent receptor [Nevskiaceae bacterium]MCP5359612.1 TonB-dependent receptor [Nevskiaceae bacterium]MCP5472595.1 TonB-dependent receptor [Nevskiaceae bacterium]